MDTVDFVSIPIWLVIPIAVLVVIGGWKLLKVILLAMKG